MSNQTIPDGYTPWHGGECPVEARGKNTRVIYRAGERVGLPLCGEEYSWPHFGEPLDIIAYRVEQADIDEVALVAARHFTRDDDPQGRAQMQCRIIAAIKNDFGPLVDLSYGEPNHGTASVMIVEQLGLDLPCTLAEIIAEIGRLQRQAKAGADDAWFLRVDPAGIEPSLPVRESESSHWSALGYQLHEMTVAKPSPVGGDRMAYEGARQDLLDWKGRAQRAEAELRRLGYKGIDASEAPVGGGVDWITPEMTGTHIVDQVRMMLMFSRIEDDEAERALAIALNRIAAPAPAGEAVGDMDESSRVPDDYRNQASGYRAGWNDRGRARGANPGPTAAGGEALNALADRVEALSVELLDACGFDPYGDRKEQAAIAYELRRIARAEGGA